MHLGTNAVHLGTSSSPSSLPSCYNDHLFANEFDKLQKKEEYQEKVMLLLQGLSNLDELVQQSMNGNLSFGETFEAACALSDDHQKVERQLQVNTFSKYFLEQKVLQFCVNFKNVMLRFLIR